MPSFKKILVPTDFSESALSVYDYVRLLAKKNDAKVDLIHVIPEISYLEISEEVMGNPFKVQAKYNELVEELDHKLEEELKRHLAKDYRGRFFIGKGGRVSEGIINHTEEINYDLLVIGSRGRSNGIFQRGSTAIKLIREAKVPVLSFNKKTKTDIDEIIVPTDGSEISLKALEIALKLAIQLEASITLFSVLEFDFAKVTLMGGDPKLSEFAAEGQKKEVLDNLKKHINSSTEFNFESKPNIRGAQLSTEKGDSIKINLILEQNISAHNAIVEFANKNADLVVMTTQGRTGLAKILLGSVAEKVVRNLEIPVLTMKPLVEKG